MDVYGRERGLDRDAGGERRVFVGIGEIKLTFARDGQGIGEIKGHSYDEQAKRQQTSFGRLQFLILLLSVAAVSLAVELNLLQDGAPIGTPPDGRWHTILHYTIIALPITLSVLMAAVSRFKQGSKWVLLRAAAEAIKREIYLFRTRTDSYRSSDNSASDRYTCLAERLIAITSQAMKTVVNETALPPYQGPIPPRMYGAAEMDDGLSDLGASQYIAVRLGDQLSYFASKTQKLERKLRALMWAIYIIGGVGTLLAAVGLQVWIAVTAALAGALTTYLEYQQVELCLIKYNQARNDLDNIRTWWQSLPPAHHTDPEMIDLLVTQTEKVLEDEFSGWVQRMQEDDLQASSEHFAQQICIARELIPEVFREREYPLSVWHMWQHAVHKMGRGGSAMRRCQSAGSAMPERQFGDAAMSDGSTHRAWSACRSTGRPSCTFGSRPPRSPIPTRRA